MSRPCKVCGISEDDALERDGSYRGCGWCGAGFCDDHQDAWFERDDCDCPRWKKVYRGFKIWNPWPQCEADLPEYAVPFGGGYMVPACRRYRWHIGGHRPVKVGPA